jgi:integrase
MTAANHADRIDGSRLLYSVPEAARLLGVGRTCMFRLLATGELSPSRSASYGRSRVTPYAHRAQITPRTPGRRQAQSRRGLDRHLPGVHHRGRHADRPRQPAPCLRALIKAAGVPDKQATEDCPRPGQWHPHEMRHSAGSYMDHMGVPPKRIASILGHDGTRTTETVYLHGQEVIDMTGDEFQTYGSQSAEGS